MPLWAPPATVAEAAEEAAVTVSQVRLRFPEFAPEDVVENDVTVSYGVPEAIIGRAIRNAQSEFAFPDSETLYWCIASHIVLEAAPAAEDGGAAPIESTGSGANTVKFAGQLADVRDVDHRTNKYGREFLRRRRAVIAEW